jgi:DNA recombination protein RmuC
MNEIVLFVAGGGIGAASMWFYARGQTETAVAAASAATDATLKAALATAEAAFLKTSSAAGKNDRDAMLALADQKMNAVLAPLKTDVARLQGYVERVDKERVEAYGSIATSIAQINAQHKALGEATNGLASQSGALVDALKNPTTRGRWGEIQLRRIVEMAGMVENCDFAEQSTISVKGEGRPDLTIRLPKSQVIHVDAKAPLAAYLAALEEPDARRQAELRKEHAKAVKSHVDELVKRSYHTSDGAVGFVVMYVPGEAFLQAAMAEAPELLEYAASRDVYVCGPLTLLPLLRSYALGWREVAQDLRAKEIATLGAELHDRLKIFMKHLGGVGVALGQATSRYNDAVGSLESRVLPQGRRMAEAASLHGDPIPAPLHIDTVPRIAPEMLPGLE